MTVSFDFKYTLFIDNCGSHLRRDVILGIYVEVFTCGVLIRPVLYDILGIDLEPTDWHQLLRRDDFRV